MMQKAFTLLANNLDVDVSPLPQADDDATLQVVFNWVFGITAGIGLIILIIAGIRFITSRGDPQAVSKAKNTIIYVAIGLVVMFFAYGIVSITLNVLGGN